MLDSSEPVVYQSSIVDKRESRNKYSINYHFYLKSPNLDKIVKIEVSPQEYESRKIKDAYRLELSDGFLNIQWSEEFF